VRHVACTLQVRGRTTNAFGGTWEIADCASCTAE
jgi:hypothetical protein